MGTGPSPRLPLLPDLCNLVGVPAKSSKVSRYAAIGIVAPHLRNQLGMLLGDRQMSVCPTPLGDRRQRAGVTFLGRYLPHDAVSSPRLSPNVAEAEKGERCPIRVRVVLVVSLHRLRCGLLRFVRRLRRYFRSPPGRSYRCEYCRRQLGLLRPGLSCFVAAARTAYTNRLNTGN
jgi:hypothetical protein